MAYEKQSNTCVLPRRKSLKKNVKSITEKEINAKKIFLKLIKPFLTNNGFIGSNYITLLENNFVTTDEKTLARTFNKYYMYIMKISSGKPTKIFPKRDTVKANREYSAMI